MRYRIARLSELSAQDWTAAKVLTAEVDRQLERHPAVSPETVRSPAAQTAYRQHLASWWLLFRLLAGEVGCSPLSLRWTRDANGKPCCENGPAFSLSHSGDFLLCAVHDSAIGADIEALRTVRPAVVRRVCSPAEAAFVGDAAQLDPLRFLAVWTAKEAVVKQTGVGLRTDLRTVTVATETELLSSVGGQMLLPLTGDGYCAALVYGSRR